MILHGGNGDGTCKASMEKVNLIITIFLLIIGEGIQN